MVFFLLINILILFNSRWLHEKCIYISRTFSSSTNMTSNVDTSKPGVYEVKYNYTNAEEVIKK